MSTELKTKLARILRLCAQGLLSDHAAYKAICELYITGENHAVY